MTDAQLIHRWTMVFAANIARLRRSRQLTQKVVAKSLGLTNVMVCYLERGKQTPSFGLMVRIAGYYGVTVADLFDERNAFKE